MHQTEDLSPHQRGFLRGRLFEVESFIGALQVQAKAANKKKEKVAVEKKKDPLEQLIRLSGK